MKRLLAGLLLVATALPAVAAAATALPVTVPANTPDIGKVMSGGGETVFTVSDTGLVTRVSGAAVRVPATGTASLPTITVTCNVQTGNTCNQGTVTVTVSAVVTPQARITRFKAINIKCDNVTCGGGTTASAPSLSFSVPAPGKGKTVTFQLPMEVTLGPSLPARGAVTYSYVVNATVN